MKELIDDFINENTLKDGHRYLCRLDGSSFHSESTVIAHFRQSHRNAIEDILSTLIQGDFK
jgi:hypothetical protein